MVELVDHTGELEMRIEHEALAGVYAEALGALAAELVDAPGDAGPRGRRPVDLSASGYDTLLADLLNEAIYLAEVEGFVADGLEPEALEETRLAGALLGYDHPGARPVVKAATLHGLALAPGGRGWRASVVLDV